MRISGKEGAAAAVAVLGGGPVGCLTALALARHAPRGPEIRLIAGRRTPPDDGRAAAIVGKSMRLLDGLGVGDAFRREGAPLAAIRLIDVTGRLVRAPDALFRASEMGEAAFGYSLTPARIVSILSRALADTGRVRVEHVDVVGIERAGAGFQLTDDAGGVLRTGFLVAADGQRSPAREAAGIAVRKWDYDQTALTFGVAHARDHDDVSSEFHTAEGPFTLVPAGPHASTIVWMMRPARAARMLALSDAGLARAAEKECRAILGKLTLTGDRGAYPMRGLLAESFAAQGIALVGEAAHAFPPIGAQGLNLGIRDGASLGAALGVAMARGDDLSSGDLLAGWDRERRRDAALRTAGVDLFNRSLLSGFPGVAAARGLGLAALNAIGPLRRAAMRVGMAE
jgi:2-octaprenyl-6-methoxyphenol hydroxylase